MPRAWRLGNRPNLRQMHDDACANRVQAALVESQLVDYIQKQKSLTSGASAAGARVHNLPERPRDIEDDGEFHYAVLGPNAASESGKPSSEAKRFLDETTAPDRPRVNRNAVVLAVPSRDGLDVARDRVREYLGWVEVRDLLKGQPVDPSREQRLASETESARRRIPDAIQQAYSIVVTVNESNDVHAFRVAVSDEPLFVIIKADRRSRIQETAISSEAMLPGGPYDLWREGRGFTPGQGPGRFLRTVCQVAQDAPPEGDTGYRRSRGQRRDMGGGVDAPRPHGQDLLAYGDRRSDPEGPGS